MLRKGSDWWLRVYRAAKFTRFYALNHVPAEAGKLDDQSGTPLGRARRAGFVIRCVA